MKAGVIFLLGHKATLTDDGWVSDSQPLADSLNEAWPIGDGFAAGDPLYWTFTQCVRDTGARVLSMPKSAELPAGVIA